MAKEKVEFDKLNLKSQTKDLTNLNIDKISAIFPNVIREKEDEAGNITKGVDFDLLKQLLSKELVDGPREKYHLDWPGKKASLLKANTPITETLRPDIANSKNWDNTKNVFIEGDNFKTLKILQESYLGKIKMIYIDPPYNTGKDFVYSDKFTINKSEYAEKIGQYDEEKNKLFKENLKTNPRYHSDWLSMMYERLHIARDLLREDGVIFISIDDNEVHNLRKICDEIFGEENFVGQFIWVTKNAARGVPPKNMMMENHEYVICYAKQSENVKFTGLDRDEEDFSNPDQDSRGLWRSESIKATGSQNNYFEIIDPETKHVHYNNWAFSETRIKKMIEEKLIIFPKSKEGTPRQKKFIDSYLNDRKAFVTYLGWFSTEASTKGLMRLFEGSKFFDFPKPISLLKFFVSQSASENDLILDFFAGSGTTAHAVMQLNAEDGGNRKFIMVQLDEETDEKSEAYKAGYKTIAELSRERIRRAGEKIVADLKSKQSSSDLKVTSSKGGQDNTTDQTTSELDIGFRAFRVDSSNMKDIRLHPANIKQQDLMQLVDTIKADRSGEDLLIQVLLDKALTLDLPIKSMKFKQNTVYIVGENDLIICMDPILDISIVDDLAKLGADTAVFRDSSFANENDRIQLDTSFKTLSPRDTKIMVI
jgi:adenine-specific DNA-methyltransferase